MLFRFGLLDLFLFFLLYNMKFEVFKVQLPGKNARFCRPCVYKPHLTFGKMSQTVHHSPPNVIYFLNKTKQTLEQHMTFICIHL